MRIEEVEVGRAYTLQNVSGVFVVSGVEKKKLNSYGNPTAVFTGTLFTKDYNATKIESRPYECFARSISHRPNDNWLEEWEQAITSRKASKQFQATLEAFLGFKVGNVERLLQSDPERVAVVVARMKRLTKR